VAADLVLGLEYWNEIAADDGIDREIVG